MPVESATTIDELDPSLPSVSDPLTEGDDHIRLIKQILKDTFTGFEQEDAGDIEARFVAIEDRLDAIEAALLLKIEAPGGNLTISGTLDCDTIQASGSSTFQGSLTCDQDINADQIICEGTVRCETLDAAIVTSAGNVIGFDGS